MLEGMSELVYLSLRKVTSSITNKDSALFQMWHFFASIF
jgi:hypothetical protein